MTKILGSYPNLRFCRIKRGTKKPFELDWTNKPYTWEMISKFLPDENYGVLCGYGDLAVIDSDKKDLQDWIDKNLPETFKIKTGGGGTHNYYFIPELKNKIILESKLTGDVSIHWGEVQSYGTQVVGAGSIHPNGNLYAPINELPIATISLEELYSAIKPFMHEVKETEEAKATERKTYGSKIDDLSVVDIWGTAGMKKQGEEYYGAHPVHGSDGGMNFWINPSKNLWHCFRCNSGGGALSAIAVKEGIISCSDAQRGQLRGDKALEAIRKAKEKYRLQDDYNVDLETGLAIPKVPEPEFTLIWDKDLKNYKENDKEWIIDKLIPSCGVGVWTGKRATYKTFAALEAIYAIASGTPFVGTYPTKKCKVLYLDKENGVSIIKNRVEMIKKGRGLIDDCDIGFICFSTLKLDKPADIKKLEDLIIKERPQVLFVDTYRRAIGFDENDAGEVSKLFVDTLRPIVEKYKMTIVLIHHDKKSTKESSGDEMDEIRGSSDLANYADFILKNKRKDNKLILEQIKNRNAPEIAPISLSFETDEKTYFRFKHEGEFVSQGKDEKCAEAIIQWIIKDSIKSFKSGEAREIAFQIGIKKSNFFYAIQMLEDRGIIRSVGKGVYDVC
jgi:RecA-family ATPase